MNSTQQISLFNGLEDASLHEALLNLPTRKFPKGMVIFEQDETGEDVFSVESGKVEIVGRNDSGELNRIALLEAGTLFGEFSYLTGTPRTTSAIATEETTLIELPARWLRDVDQRFPEVRKRLVDLYRARALTNVLRHSTLFSTLDPKELNDLAGKMTLRAYQPGDEIIREGAKDLTLHVIKKGKVLITKRKGSDETKLSELVSGDIMGEMALITGEPRSATARANTDVEVMELSGDNFRTLIHQHPKILHLIEDVVRSRAEQTRQALDEVAKELLGQEGIQLGSLKTSVECLKEGKTIPGTVKRVAVGPWVIEPNENALNFEKGSLIQLQLKRDRIKELDSQWLKEPLSAQVEEIRGSEVTVGFRPSDDATIRLSKIVTALARARMRMFVYPEYDVSKLSVIAEIITKSDAKTFAPVQALSHTQGKIKISDLWNPGETAVIKLYEKNQEILTTRALCLDNQDGIAEFQFEYETGKERTLLEDLLRSLTRKLGYGAPPLTAAKTSTNEATLLKTFASGKDLLKEYMEAVETGFMTMPASSKLAMGAKVLVTFAITSEGAQAKKLGCGGNVLRWQEGKADVELEDPQFQLRDRIEQLARKMVEERVEEKWKKRKDELTSPTERLSRKLPTKSNDTRPKKTIPLKHWIILGLVLFWLVGVVLWLTR